MDTLTRDPPADRNVFHRVVRGVIARTRAHALPSFVISLTARHPWGP